ncbi:MAG: P1 family peptidase [Coriobacteriaceae bacterium]|nr:P1 family peptidase [Coriobacteriaceae bacterium]
MSHAALSPIPASAIPGFRIGHWTSLEAGTGCTAIVCEQGAVGGVDVRGGAPATRETDLLRPEETVGAVHAVMLSGGSAFGLEAASGAARELERRGIGLPVGPARVPIVTGACLFDLMFGDPQARPDLAAGAAAVSDAFEGSDSDAEGCVGAGTGATVGKLLGPGRVMKGGLGARAFALGPLQVGAIAAVNACGNVVDPHDGAPVAGLLSEEGDRVLDMEGAMLEAGAALAMPLAQERANTTISCVFTNARLTKAQATKVAQMAADAYAHTIRPTHTTNDGDAVFALASGEIVADAAEIPLDLIGLVATRALEAAIVAGAREARALHGTPAAGNLAGQA